MIGRMEDKQFVMWDVFGGFFGFYCYNHVEKTPPQPLLQIDKPQKPTQTKNKTQNKP